MTFDWVIHAACFLVLVSYRGKTANYRRWVSVIAAALTGLSLALTFYALMMPPNRIVTAVGVLLLYALIRCRGNVAKLFRSCIHGSTAGRH